MRLALTTRPSPDASGAVPLYVRIAHAAKERYVALGLRVHPRDWNARRSEVRKSHPDHVAFQELLVGRLRVAEKAAAGELGARGRHATPDEIKDAVALALHPPAAEAAVGVVSYGRTLQAGMRAAGKVGTALRHFEDTLTLDHMGGGVTFADVTPALLHRHEERRAKTAAIKTGVMQELLTGRTRLVPSVS